MAVHLPLSAEAQAEARMLMLSAHNILSPASGRPIAVPSQDMIIGVYYLTEQVDGAGTGRVFSSLNEAVAAYEERYSAAGETVSLHTKIKVRMPASKFPADRFERPAEDGTPKSIVLREYGNNGTSEVLVESSLGRFLLNTAFPDDFPFADQTMKKRDITEVVGELVVSLRQGGRRRQPRPAEGPRLRVVDPGRARRSRSPTSRRRRPRPGCSRSSRARRRRSRTSTSAASSPTTSGASRRSRSGPTPPTR